ncbi:MAG: methyltransferase domain-containing protein [Thermodesulfobacteriota bacterium]
MKQISVPIGSLNIRLPVPPEQTESGDRISFWWGITSAAVALSLYLERTGDLSGERVIELGCGLGLAGCTAALLGAEVTFTDYVEAALTFARETCQLNDVPPDNVRFKLLDWDEPAGVETFGLVLGSEIAYDYFTHGSLVRLIDEILALNGTALLAERKRLAVSRFLGRLISRGLVTSETVVPVAVPGFPEQTISIFRIERNDTRQSHAL